jgi:quercetin dioxygenase-like cupin family protein
MNNQEYGEAVNAKNYPQDIVVPMDAPFVDDRGVIQNIWLANSESITLITSKKGATRASHKHLSSNHSTYIISGSVRYQELEDDQETIMLEKVFGANDQFFTRPQVFHIMTFLEDTVMITMNGHIKNHQNYEDDLIRMTKKDSK